jgi:hypothetical protein
MVVIQATADQRVADPKCFEARDDGDGSICSEHPNSAKTADPVFL